MKLQVCLAFLALASCASAHIITLTIWTSETFEKSYTQTLVVLPGSTFKDVMDIASLDNNPYFGWSFIPGGNPDSAYLTIGGISDDSTARTYWIPYAMSTKPSPCNLPGNTDGLAYDITSTVVADGMNYLLWYIFVD